ncbi:MAG TPA: diacylglycerol kinase family protein [Candidatus Angelobacter sp.]|jgi:diacylglycerol kinase (ATP)
MIAAAVLHPNLSPEIVEPFRIAGVELSIKDCLVAPKDCSAALIFGGDGTVHRHLQQLHHHQIPTLVVPTGSGNDFAKALGIFSVKDARRAWGQFCATGRNVQEIDLGVIEPIDPPSKEEIFFCSAAAIGMDADANARANRMPVWLKKHGGYLLAGLQSLLAFRPVELSVAAGERRIRRAAFFLTIGNAQRYGGGMRVTPRAIMTDGVLDLCLVSKMNKLKLLCWVPTIFFGGYLRLSGVEYFQSQSVRIESAGELHIYADGDFACSTPAEISVLPKALRVIVPDAISL